MSEVRLTVTASELEAEMVCGLLRTNGIRCDCRITDPSAAIFGATLAGGGAREVVVSATDLERARAVLDGSAKKR
jgi:hypothetical protein